MSFFLGAGLPELGLQREVSTEGESDFFQERSIAWKESSEPAAVRADLGEGFSQGQVVIELPESEVPALESVVGVLDHVMDVSVQVAEERSVYYVEEEPPVLELEEPPTIGKGIPRMGMRLQGRPGDRNVRPESQLWKRGWRCTLGWRLLIFLPYFRGQFGTSL